MRNCNRALRAAILGIAANLITCNHHFRVLATTWAAQGKDPRHSHVQVAVRCCRIAFQWSLAGRCFAIPACRGGTIFSTS